MPRSSRTWGSGIRPRWPWHARQVWTCGSPRTASPSTIAVGAGPTEAIEGEPHRDTAILSAEQGPCPAPASRERGTREGHVVRFAFVGGQSRAVVGELPDTACSHFLRTRGSSMQPATARHYRRLSAASVWPGIDLVLHLTDGGPRYDIVVQPGAQVRDVRLQIDGADTVALTDDGNLQLGTSVGKVSHSRPFAYQLRGGRMQPVACEYQLDRRTLSFVVGEHDLTQPLIIDPTVYCTLVGGLTHDYLYDAKTDAAGNTYACGETWSTDYPATPGGLLDRQTHSLGSDGTILKLSPTGHLLFATYIGGTLDDACNSIAIDPATGNIVVGGGTESGNFPVTAGAYQTVPGSTGVDYGDWFLSILPPSGASLLYSTRFGGIGGDRVDMLAVSLRPGRGNRIRPVRRTCRSPPLGRRSMPTPVVVTSSSRASTRPSAGCCSRATTAALAATSSGRLG
jgi:hypothetical protein